MSRFHQWKVEREERWFGKIKKEKSRETGVLHKNNKSYTGNWRLIG
jgi:hypothetical protein